CTRDGGDRALGEEHPTALLFALDHVQDPRPGGRHGPWARLGGGALSRPGGLNAGGGLGGGRERQTRAVAGAHTIDEGAQEIALAREHELWVADQRRSDQGLAAMGVDVACEPVED